jgi:hypothetical protein
MEFASPAAGSVLKPASVEGHLLVVEPEEYIERMTTQMGESDAVRCTVHDITEGQTHESVLWFSTILVGSLRTRVGQKVLGVMGKGVAKPGQTAPWILVDAIGQTAALEAARNYMATRTPAEPKADELADALSRLGATPF